MNFSCFFSSKAEIKKGFTLIELLVVIAIVGLLSSIVLASLKSARIKANYARSRIELNQFIKTAIIAQGESVKTLKEITGSGCSACGCAGRDLRNVLSTDICYTKWINALTKIQEATLGTISGIDRMTRDPWGSPYLLDENEREFGPADCRFDIILSVGPDGFRSTGDDLGYRIPHSSPCP